ncbi:MAG: phosphohistidine phosphatase [Paraglaciecola sp.]|jgi:phosphohistidine phosphatase
MQIIIMRHGDAEPLKKNDITRNLSHLGVQQAMEAGRWLNEYYLTSNGIDAAFVSPYFRAKQTFDQLKLHVNVGKMQVVEDITPDGNPRLVHDHIDYMLQERKLIQSLLIVSHMPFVSYLVDELLSYRESLLFATSSLAIIDYPSSKLVEVYHPQC